MSSILPFLKGVSAWLGATERAPGELWCSKHQIEHTGTGAYAAMLDAYLYESGGSLDRAKRVAARVCERVRTDPGEKYIAWIVMPGSRDPNNHANNAIDAGCAIDSLATLARLRGAELGEELTNKIRDAVIKVSDTYILPHARPKEILAQRLWSMAALGSAYAWLRKPEWRDAGLETLQKTVSQQNSDGSFPYTPLGTPRSHPGSADVSEFYHSRHALFIAHALVSMGEDPAREPWASSLRAASEFLLSLRKADGTKCIFIEAKPWYWGSPYEVAGFSFDIAALAACGRLLGENKYSQAAREMFEMFTKHVEPDGGVTSHLDSAGRRNWNFQCRFFWNAHCAWIAREMQTLENAPVPVRDPNIKIPKKLAWFADAGVANYTDERMIVILRGKAPRRNINHGSPLSGGGILSFGARADGAERILKNPLDRYISGEWYALPAGAPGLFKRLQKSWRENREEIRFSSWIARVRARSGDRGGAIAWYLDRVRRGLWLASRKGYSSAFATKVEAQLVQESLAFRGGVADAFGDAFPGILTIRRYVFERGVARVGEALVTEIPLKSCVYRLPATARDAAFDGATARVRDGMVYFNNIPKGATLAVRYVLSAQDPGS